MKKTVNFLACILSIGLFVSCSHFHKAYVVEDGVSLKETAEKYDVTVADIIKNHRITLEDGKQVYVPVMTRDIFLETRKHYFKPQRDFIWPVIGRLTSKFGKRWGKKHEGIDVSAPRGTPIRSVQSGIVIHSGNSVTGYGNMVIVAHKGGYASVYAHNKRNLASEGDIIQRGQVIAEVGSTGHSTGPHLHFELRKNNIAKNPLSYLKKTIFFSQN
jgi:murein DD-endopeptidase MepM/ murein hydrolase activator NlpD